MLTRKGVKYALYVDSLQLKERYPLPVVLVAIRKGNKILLGKRCREPCKGYWGLPGNEISYGDSPLESARSEIKNEIGYCTSDERIYGSYPTIYRENGEIIYHVILLAVKAKIGKIPEKGRATGKIDKYQFFTRSQIKDLQIIPSNLQPILDAFSNKDKIEIQDLNSSF